MSGRRMAFAAAAQGLVGTPFRFRGRDLRTGLDCVGLVLVALQRLGSPPPEIASYSMRQRDFTDQLASAAAAGFDSVAGPLAPGDLLLLRPGPAQGHLAVVASGGAIVHAHAGLRRVVTTPLPCPYPVEHHWRLRQD